jgi:hypothetical protein
MRKSMRKPAKTPKECIDHLDAGAKALEADGATASNIMGALLQLYIRYANRGRRAAADLDLAADMFQNYAHRAFEQAKKDRAAKRRKSLGLPEE